MANPPGNQPSRDHRSSKPVELPMECAGPSTRSVPAVSLALLRMSIAASEGEPELSGEEDSAVLLRCGLHRCLHHRLGGMFDGLAVSVVWTGPQLRWHINYLEFLAVRLALNRCKGRLRGKHVLLRSDNTATIVNINRKGSLHFRRMSQLARHLLPGVRSI